MPHCRREPEEPEGARPIGKWPTSPTRPASSPCRAALVPWLAGRRGALFAVGLYLGFVAPADYQQGDSVRIMYVHVPAAWLAMAATR